jgi:hypothetical protein
MPATFVAVPALVAVGARLEALTLQASNEALTLPPPLVAAGGVQAATIRLDATTAPRAALMPIERIADKRSSMSHSLRALESACAFLRARDQSLLRSGAQAIEPLARTLDWPRLVLYGSHVNWLLTVC